MGSTCSEEKERRVMPHIISPDAVIVRGSKRIAQPGTQYKMWLPAGDMRVQYTAKELWMIYVHDGKERIHLKKSYYRKPWKTSKLLTQKTFDVHQLLTHPNAIARQLGLYLLGETNEFWENVDAQSEARSKVS
jgi:hypothetical protein